MDHLLDWLIGLINLVLTGLGVVFWRSYSSMRKDIDEIQKDLVATKIDLPKSYIAKHDFDRFEERLFSKLDKIDMKIDLKQDKLQIDNLR